MTKKASITGVSFEGRRVRLRPLREVDLPTLAKWRNDISDLVRYSDVRFVVPEHVFIEQVRNREKHDVAPFLLIEEKSSQQLIGHVNMYDYNRDDNHAFLGIYICPAKRSLYFGLEAFIIFVKYLFACFSLNKLYLDVFEYNPEAWQVIEKLGFQKEGEFKRHILYDGQYWTMFRFAMHREDLGIVERFHRRFQSADRHSVEERLRAR
jgi:RimJ/RimL family protein N-acetyltransferase